MPYKSFETPAIAVKNAKRFINEAGCEAIKLEGGAGVIDQTRAVVAAGIPVMGHIGLTPQTADKLGGFKVQGKDAARARVILDDARKLEDAGCFSIILECVPDRLAKMICESVGIPVIGIGAGKYCDGQALVLYDAIGLFDRFTPKFTKRFADVSAVVSAGVKRFVEEVSSGVFPSSEHSFTIKDEELEKLKTK